MIPTPQELMARAGELNQSCRRGQQLFTALQQLSPELARKLTATDADCFFNDNRIPAFWAAIAKERLTQ